MEKNTNNSDILKTKTGSNEQPRGIVSPAKVIIASAIVKTKDKEGRQMNTPLIQFMVKHPDKEDLIIISKVQVMDNKKIINKSFWVQTDEDNAFYKGSSIDAVLTALGCETLEDTYGREIDTIEESENIPYLCFKAY